MGSGGMWQAVKWLEGPVAVQQMAQATGLMEQRPVVSAGSAVVKPGNRKQDDQGRWWVGKMWGFM